MRIPTNVEEIQQLMERLVALSSFISCEGDKAFLFFRRHKKEREV